jgi:uncharacterized membrane protein required for colicin V production
VSISLILDIVFLVIAIFIILKYTIDGFLKSVLNFARLALSVVLAIVLRNPVAELLNNLFMKKAIVNWVNGSILKHLNGEDPTIDFVGIHKQTPIFYSQVLSRFGLDTSSVDNQMNNLSAETAPELSEAIGTAVATMLSTIIAVIVVFIVAMLVFTLVFTLLNCVTKISGIKLINRLLGVALGVAIALAAIWGLGVLVKTLVDMLGPMYPNVFNQDLIDNSMVLGMLEKLRINSLVENVKTQITNK